VLGRVDSYGGRWTQVYVLSVVLSPSHTQGIILLKAVWKEDAQETICATARGSHNMREKYSRSGTVLPTSLTL